MPTNILIGIGGSGARIIESFVHLCAAGYGPDSVKIMIIDPDEGNGNLTQTKSLINDYQTCRTGIDRSVFPGTDVPFRTEIITYSQYVWGIFKEGNTSLGKYLGYDALKVGDPALANLIKLLYSEEELKVNLNEGFRGHPSIGAAVMSRADTRESPWREFWADVQAASHESEVRVFVVGSVFGGTGAAGFPTLGAPRFLKENDLALLDKDKKVSKIFLGGALVLPYFSFDPPKQDRKDLFVTVADFPTATKAALHYYYGRELGYDQMFFLGDSLQQKVGEFAHGNVAQRNKAHYIELVGALAAGGFFGQEVKKGPPKYFISDRSDRTIGWSDIPFTSEIDRAPGLARAFKREMVKMTAFSLAFSTYGEFFLKLEPGDSQVRIIAWFRDNFRKDHPRVGYEGDGPLFKVVGYTRKFLRWFAEVCQDDEVKMVRSDLLWDGDGPRGIKAHEHTLGQFCLGGQTKGMKFQDFYDILDKTRLDGSIPPANRYLGLFYRGASEFCETNYLL